jgi:hypothetical protein
MSPSRRGGAERGGLGDRLRALDQVLLVPVARGYRRLIAGRRRPHGLTVAACLVVALAVSAAAWQADRAAPASDLSAGEVVRVGVAQGASVPAYQRASAEELDELAATGTAESYALISFSAYLAPDRLASILAGAGVAAVYVRVPLAGVQTEIVRIPVTTVPADVVTGMDQIADRKEREAAQYQERLTTVTGTDMLAVYRSGARIAAAEHEAYARRCSCAYAAVVRATPVALRQIARRAGVRVVDAAPEVRRLDRAVFWPALPEQRDLATPPGDNRR